MHKGLPRRSWACPAALRGVFNAEGASETTAPKCTKVPWETLSRYVGAFRDEAHPQHARAQGLFNHSGHSLDGGDDDSYNCCRWYDRMLIPTVNYLRGIDCQTQELAFICVNRFDGDLQRFAESKRAPWSSQAAAPHERSMTSEHCGRRT